MIEIRTIRWVKNDYVLSYMKFYWMQNHLILDVLPLVSDDFAFRSKGYWLYMEITMSLHSDLAFRYLQCTVSSILPTRHFESNWHLAIIYIILNWNVRLYLCYSGNDMEILTYKSGGFQPRIPKSTYSCSFWWIYFLVHSILPTKNPILTSLQCIKPSYFSHDRLFDYRFWITSIQFSSISDTYMNVFIGYYWLNRSECIQMT